MRRKSKIIASAFLLLLLMAVPSFGDSDTYNGSCRFDGEKIVSDFDSETVADAVTNLQPGDAVTFTVKYTNDSDIETDWYLENEVIRTLEKTEQARKTVKGTGTAEGGGYTYELLHKDKDGKETVLFSNSKVGGEATPGGREGLEQATNATEDWFFIQTLAKGEYGTVTLHVAFEGETEVNDYMDTSGSLRLRFAVEKRGTSGSLIKTGDDTRLLPWFLAMTGAGLVLLLAALRSRRKEADHA